MRCRYLPQGPLPLRRYRGSGGYTSARHCTSSLPHRPSQRAGSGSDLRGIPNRPPRRRRRGPFPGSEGSPVHRRRRWGRRRGAPGARGGGGEVSGSTVEVVREVSCDPCMESVYTSGSLGDAGWGPPGGGGGDGEVPGGSVGASGGGGEVVGGRRRRRGGGSEGGQ